MIGGVLSQLKAQELYILNCEDDYGLRPRLFSQLRMSNSWVFILYVISDPDSIDSSTLTRVRARVNASRIFCNAIVYMNTILVLETSAIVMIILISMFMMCYHGY